MLSRRRRDTADRPPRPGSPAWEWPGWSSSPSWPHPQRPYEELCCAFPGAHDPAGPRRAPRRRDRRPVRRKMAGGNRLPSSDTRRRCAVPGASCAAKSESSPARRCGRSCRCTPSSRTLAARAAALAASTPTRSASPPCWAWSALTCRPDPLPGLLPCSDDDPRPPARRVIAHPGNRADRKRTSGRTPAETAAHQAHRRSHLYHHDHAVKFPRNGTNLLEVKGSGPWR